MKWVEWALKPFRILALTVAFSLAILIGLLDYLLASDGGAESLAKGIEYSYRFVHLENVSGSVAKGLDIKKLEILPWVEIDQLHLVLNLSCLLKFSLCVSDISAKQVKINLHKGSGHEGELILPRVFLPVPIDLEKLSIKSLLIQQQHSSIAVKNIFIQGQAALPNITIASAKAEYDGFSAQLQGVITLEKDYPLSAEANILHANSDTRIVLKASDSIKQLKLLADVKQQGELNLKAALKPLEDNIPLELSAESNGTFVYPLDANRELKLDKLHLSAKGNRKQLAVEGGIHLFGSAVPQTNAEWKTHLSADRVTIENLVLRTLAGEINANGFVSLQAAPAWQAQWQIKNIQTQEYWPELQSQLNGSGSSTGRIENNKLGLSVQVDRLTGSWRNYLLNASGAVSHDGLVWSFANVDLALGNNSVKLNGNLNHQWDLKGIIQAPNLRAFWPSLAGELSGQFSVAGQPKAPSITADVNAKKIVFNGIRANAISLKTSVVELASQESSLNLKADALEVSGYDLGLVTLDTKGSQQNHSVNLSVNGPATLSSAELGGIWSGKQWEGSLRKANIKLKSAALSEWALAQSLPMRWTKKNGLKIEAFCWQHLTASLCSEGPLVVGQKGQLALNLQGLQTDWLAPHFPDGFSWSAGLNMHANVEWAPNAATRAELALRSTPGTIRLEQSNNQPLQFQYSQLSLTGDLKNNLLSTSARFDSESLGELQADVNVALKDPANRTLDGLVKLNGLQLNVFKPFYSKLDKLEGTLSADGRMSGTLTSPKFIGAVVLENGKISAENMPLSIQNLQAKADLYGTAGSLIGQFNSGAGYANFNGSFKWDELLVGNLHLVGGNLQLKPTRGLKMTVQPDLNAEFSGTNLKLTGKVDVTDGSLIAKALPVDAVEESGDTILVGEQKVKKSALKISTDVAVNIADNFEFTGFGAEGKLGGAVRITQSPEQEMPFGDGEIQLKDGKYTIYGQRLTIREGRLMFGGPVDLPTMQIEAIRKIEDQVVGIRIFGRVDQANSTLFSEPSLPEETALSYLVTGKPPSTGNTAQNNNYMGQAAVALGVMGGEGVARDVAEKIGVSDFSLSSDTTTDGKQLVAVAGYISPKLYVRYGMGVFEPGNTVTLRYNLTPKLYFEAVNGLKSALDLIYTFDIGKKTVAEASP